jgi:hypothetical protein
MMCEREIAGPKCVVLEPRVLAKAAKRKADQPIETNDSAKSRDFAPNDFKDLSFRFVSHGAIFVSLGAIISSKWTPPHFMRKETP